MAYGWQEFPSTNVYQSDLQEMIRLYREMSSKYDVFVETVKDLELKWSQLDEKIDAAVVKGVKDATAQIIADVDKTVKELRDFVNGQLAQNANDMQELRTYVNDNVRMLNAQMQTINDDLDSALSELHSAINEVDAKIANEIALYDNSINEKIDNMTNGMWLEIDELKTRLDNYSEEFPPVTNPIDGVLEPIDDVLNQMWYWMRVMGITAIEYDSLGMEAEQYDDVALTAAEFDYYARWYLIGYMTRLVISPPSGENVDINTALVQMDRNFTKYAYTSLLYDTLGVTAYDYDNIYRFTAYDLDYKGAAYLCKDKFIAYEIEDGIYQYVGDYNVTVDADVETSYYGLSLLSGNDYVREVIPTTVLSSTLTLSSDDSTKIVQMPVLITGEGISESGYTDSTKLIDYLRNVGFYNDGDTQYIATINIIFSGWRMPAER